MIFITFIAWWLFNVHVPWWWWLLALAMDSQHNAQQKRR